MAALVTKLAAAGQLENLRSYPDSLLAAMFSLSPAPRPNFQAFKTGVETKHKNDKLNKQSNR